MFSKKKTNFLVTNVKINHLETSLCKTKYIHFPCIIRTLFCAGFSPSGLFQHCQLKSLCFFTEHFLKCI